MKSLLKLTVLISAASLMWSCAGSQSTETDPAVKAVEERISAMTLRQRVGQLFFIRPENLQPEYVSGQSSVPLVTEFTDTMVSAFVKYPCGGFVLFAYNCVNPEQIHALVDRIHTLEDRPMVCIDEEGGRVARIGNNDAFGLKKIPNMTALSKFGVDSVRNAAGYIGAYLAEYGFDADLAPVADVNSNPLSPIIGVRAFSENPDTAAKMVCAYMEGLQSRGVLSCLKHFPGHGEAATDSHLGYAESGKTWEEMLECEMKPFKAGIEKDVPMIMIAHITAPQVDTNCIPSTLSRIIIEEKLRGELGYKGLVVTDGMGMGAISKHYTAAEAAIAAIQAGVDVVLLPANYMEAFEAVVKAVEDGTISEDRINASVRRILLAKTKKQ